MQAVDPDIKLLKRSDLHFKHLCFGGSQRGKSQHSPSNAKVGKQPNMQEILGNQQQSTRAIQCKVLKYEHLPVSTFADNLHFEIIDSTSSRDWVCCSHRRCVLVVFTMACVDTPKMYMNLMWR